MIMYVCRNDLFFVDETTNSIFSMDIDGEWILEPFIMEFILKNHGTLLGHI